MPAVRVAALSLNQTPLAWEENSQNIQGALEEARRAGASVVCLPELCLSGYGCEDAFLWPNTTNLAWLALQSVLPSTRGLVVSVGLPIAFEGSVYNGSALLVNGKVAGICCKRHLAKDGLHYEPRWFTPWPVGKQAEIVDGPTRIPLGDLLFEVGGIRMGFEICEDAWVRHRPAHELGRAGATLLFGPSASHFAFGKHLRRRKLVLSGAQSTGAYVYCNLLGNEAGRAIYDGDCLIATGRAHPEIIAEARRLSFGPRKMACATLDLRSSGPVEALADDPSRTMVKAPFSYPAHPSRGVLAEPTKGADRTGYMPRSEAIARVIALGLFDYMRKTGSLGFVISLSGGADSTAVALLVRLMVRLGIAELGVAAFVARLEYPLEPEAGITWTEPMLVRRLLLTVYQSTKNSSEVTRLAAMRIAEALGSEHHEFSIEDLVESYRDKVQAVLGRQLDWQRDDVSLQNIQARARSPGIWMLANVRNALLLATSNRSEAAVGYTTMDGDTSGGLSPIAGLDKVQLCKWLLFMERKGIEEFSPLPELAAVNQQQPTAELRPPSYGQTDEKDLMPYDVLDVLERSAIFEGLSPSQVLERIKREFPAHAGEAERWVVRFFQLFAQNQWKRERLAPSFHLDEGNLDPRTWCRFPILSGGFRQELAALSAAGSEPSEA